MGFRPKSRFFAIPTLFALGVIVALVFIFSPLQTSNSHVEKANDSTYPFINLIDNRIEYRPNAELGKHFNDLVRLAVSGLQPLTILHIGDSHVQADVFTGETRRLLSNWLNDTCSARGFTFPYSIVRSNNPDDYDISWQGEWKRNRPINGAAINMGLAGISISTADTASHFSISLKNSAAKTALFDKVRVFYHASDSTTAPTISASFSDRCNANGIATFTLEKPMGSIGVKFNWLGNSADTVTLYGVELTHSKSKLIYHSAGVNGASTGTYLQSSNFATIAKEINPSVIIISLGTNDVYNPSFNAIDYGNNLRRLVELLKVTNENSLVILTTPGDHLIDKQLYNPNIEMAQSEIYAVASELGCGVWDFFHIMGGPGSIEQWLSNGLCAPDKLHLNRSGYRVKGALLYEALVGLASDSDNLIASKELIINE